MDNILKSHLVDPEALRSDDFERMIEKRRQWLLQMIGDAMGKDVVSGTDAEEGEEMVIDESLTYESVT